MTLFIYDSEIHFVIRLISFFVSNSPKLHTPFILLNGDDPILISGAHKVD